MGEILQFERRRPARRRSEPVTIFFDLACPYTYLVAERLDRRFGDARWVPAAGRHLLASPFLPNGRQRASERAEALRLVERRARELHMPLVWPERFPAPVPAAMRAATFASWRGRGPAFAIALGRLAFCGGFDLDDPRTLGEAAAAAGLDVRETLAAAADPRRDRQVQAAGRALWVGGGTTLPAVRHAGGLFCGEAGVTAAMVAPAARFAGS